MALDGKIALVTGAASGIGRAAAIEVAQDGADVALVDINREALDETADLVRQLGRRGVAIQADLRSLSEIDRMVDEAAGTLGGIDILVNSAGVTWRRDFLDITEDDWGRILQINAKGAFFCMQRVARQMIEQGRGGRIVNMASIAGKGSPGTSNAVYGASKGAVIAMTLVAARQLSAHDINVNAVCPGGTNTPMFAGVNADRLDLAGVSREELERERARSVPLGRYNEPEDVAAMILFLAGPGSRNITGQTINVDGGLVMH